MPSSQARRATVRRLAATISHSGASMLKDPERHNPVADAGTELVRLLLEHHLPLPAFPDLVDAAVAVARQSLQVEPQRFVDLLDLLVGTGLGEGVPVENLALGNFGLVGLSHLGDARLLLVGQRTLSGAGFSVLLAQALDRKLERRLGGVAGHDVDSVA